MADMPDLAAYGVISAALCNSSGRDCVQPSVSNVSAALNSATKDSAGLLQVNPARVPAGDYPLVDVVYAAVPTNQPAAALNAYADFIAYAAGQGQTTGTAPGELPPGYLPLTARLQAQAASVVTKLRDIAGPGPTHSPTPTHSATRSSTPTESPTRGQSGLPTTATTTPGGTTPTSGTTPTPTVGASATPTTRPGGAGPTTSSSPSAQGPATIAPSASLAAGNTPSNESGGIRLALVVVLIIGASGALGGSVLRFGRMPQFGRSRRRNDEFESP
jgi:hypothetical protein